MCVLNWLIIIIAESRQHWVDWLFVLKCKKQKEANPMES
jgi:hypothetical protein